MLKTVLFTDIVGSTERAAGIGDRRWIDLLDAHDSEIRRELVLYSGDEVNTTGDGFLAAFDGPARAIRCAQADRDGRDGSASRFAVVCTRASASAWRRPRRDRGAHRCACRRAGRSE